jgi:hypothetical protein
MTGHALQQQPHAREGVIDGIVHSIDPRGLGFDWLEGVVGLPVACVATRRVLSTQHPPQQQHHTIPTQAERASSTHARRTTTTASIVVVRPPLSRSPPRQTSSSGPAVVRHAHPSSTHTHERTTQAVHARGKQPVSIDRSIDPFRSLLLTLPPPPPTPPPAHHDRKPWDASRYRLWVPVWP